MIKVASYCRVSTDKDDQANSFETQKRYFREYIECHSDWELYEIYADEGITGTTTKKRTQFNRMINDAYEGKFQMIITKEVSRFSRNILDTIAYTRELKAIGIGVIFATDRINTLDPEAEMLLSYLASMAQEESRRTSSRVVWGQTRQMELGVVFGQSLLGYDVKDGVLTINPEGEEIVRLIFHKYAMEHVGTSEIARYMACKGYLTYRGNAKWTSNTVIKILNNEKYVGDLIQKKTYTPDFLTHAKRTNKGEVPFVIIRNHHEPIVSREVWNLAQERLRKNNKHRKGEGGHSNRYVFSGKIKCGECGSSFVGRFKYLKDGSRIRRWSCGTATKEGIVSCDVGKLVRDDDAIQMLKISIQSLWMDTKSVADHVTALALEAIREGENGAGDDLQHFQSEIKRVQKRKETMMDSYFSGEITKEDMQTMNRKYDGKIKELRQRKKEVELCQQGHRDSTTLYAAIQSEVSGILSGEIESEAFYKTMLKSLTVYKDRHIELRLNKLPQVFRFAG